MSAPIDPGELLAHREFVRAVARRLVYGEASVDDVEQQTWLAALERPPRRAAGLRAWLGVVARRFALRAKRSEGRRERRERNAAQPEALRSTADAVVELAAHRRVVDSVLALDEPYRSTVLLRYYRGQSAAEIAERTGVPAATVRTRLRRALQLLRGRLDDEHRGDRRAWCVALLPLADAPARAAALPAAAAIVATGAIVALTFAVADREDAPVAGSRDRPPVEVAHAPSPETSTAPAPLPPEASDPVRYSVGGSVDAPLSGARAHLRAYGAWRLLPMAWHEGPHSRIVRLEGDGSFRFDGVEPGRYAVGVESSRGELLRETYVRVAAKSPAPTVRFRFGNARLEGHVFDSLGRAAPDVFVTVSTKSKESQNRWTRSDADGFYALDGLPAGRCWVGTRSGETPRDDPLGLTRSVTLVAGEVVTLDLGRVLPLPTWTGVVRTRTGDAVRGPGRIQLGPLGATGYSFLAFDAGGRFHGPILPDRYRLLLHLEGVRFLEAGTLEVADADLSHDLVVPGTTLRGRSSGSAVRLVPLSEGFEPTHFRRVRVAADGTFRIDGVAAGRYRIESGRRTATFEVAADALEQFVEVE